MYVYGLVHSCTEQNITPKVALVYSVVVVVVPRPTAMHQSKLAERRVGEIHPGVALISGK